MSDVRESSHSKGGRRRRVAVIGLDCAPPELVFDKFRHTLPNLGRLIDGGLHGMLESTIPPITVPAWMSMMTGKNPGRLGFYGFRNRTSYAYEELGLTNSANVKEATVWDILSAAGKKVVVLGVPPTYPPKPVNGCLVTCFLTPNADCEFTYPPELKGEVEKVVGRYLFDVENFRTDNKRVLLEQIYDMTEKRFRLARHLIRAKEWDFFMMMEIGPDRIHHAFWKYFDPEHRKHEPGSPFEHAIRDYYRYLDDRIGELLADLDDDTTVLVVSDHGAKRMDGGICLNEWLIQEGYLRLRERPQGVVPLGKASVEWGSTAAWGAGGYYGRIFLNVKGREPQGVIDPVRYEAVRDELTAKILALRDDQGRPMNNKVFKPQEVYPECRGIPPDLIVYFGDLYWRAIGSVGRNGIHVLENDTGPDDANHAQHGIFILYDPAVQQGRRVGPLQIVDCAPTILRLLGLSIPQDMEGKVVE